MKGTRDKTLDMTDRTIHLAAAGALLCLVPALAACQQRAPTEQATLAAVPAQGFQDAGTPTDPADFARTLFADDGLDASVSLNGDLRTRYFTPELAGLMADTVRDDPTRLTSNPLCLCLNPKALKQDVTRTVLDQNRAMVYVTVTRSGTADGPTQRLILLLSQDPDGWRLADVLYPESHESLRKILAKANAGDLEIRAPV